MPVLGLLGGLFSGIGSIVGGLFNFKSEQARTVQAAIEVIGQTNASAGQREQAIAQIISAENASGSWLASTWRPLTMVIFLFIIISFWFGYVPPNLMGPMPPMIDKMFDLITIGMSGYMGGRTIEKIIGSLNIGRVLQTLIDKKLV